MIDITAIRTAAERISGRVMRTPLMSSSALGGRAGVSLWLKCECFQKTGSFKARGALNKALSLTTSQKARGLITVSAGNHAQALAWAAREVGVACAVVMPTDAPRNKIDAVEGYGAETILHDDRASLFDRLEEEQRARGSIFVHPFDDETVIAGAGTTGLEIVDDVPELDMVLVPVGGGGLLAGVASAVAALRPAVRVVAVELAAGPGLGPALEAGRPVAVSRPAQTLADGLTPPFVGQIPLEVARATGLEVVTVSEQEIVDTVVMLMQRAKLVVEGSGAVATAALIHGRVAVAADSRVVALVSGGNLDLAALCGALGR